MSAITPSGSGPASFQPTAPAQARTAQAAFFRAALGQASAPAPTAVTAEPTAAGQSQERPQRPGALLDIRV
jgi:hypothetical protein